MCSRHVDSCGANLVADGSARATLAQLLDDAAEMREKRPFRPIKKPSIASSEQFASQQSGRFGGLRDNILVNRACRAV